MKKKFRWSFRSKLMTFVFLICLVLIGLVYALSVLSLEPAYNRRIREDLSATLNNLVSLMDNADHPLTTPGLLGIPQRTTAFNDQLSSLIQSGQLSGLCVEIATSAGQKVFSMEALPTTCLLHTGKLLASSSSGLSVIDAEIASQMRYITIVDGQVTRVLENSSTGAQQLVMGKLTADGSYTVLVSTDLARIPQAAAVLAGQMKWVALLLLAVSLAGAWIFSTIFTRPLRQLSGAAREMARGNYKVQVEEEGQDEVADLARDFNFMAREVDRSARLQQELIANISHDLRTPLTLIKGYAETLRDLTGDDAQKRTQQLNVIVDETDRLSALVNSVMDLSKIGTGAEKPQMVDFDLAQLCDEVAQRYEDVCAKNGYTLETHTDEECLVHADAAMLERVLHNLLGNALHHVGPDGWLGLSAKPLPGGGCRVEVSDHGCGIPAEDLPHLFDKYYRSRQDAGKVGNGLGLSITKAILQSHGFRFGVESTVGQGSVFWFEAAAPGQPPRAQGK